MSVDGKGALITRASRYIGRARAAMLACKGGDLVLLDKNTESLTFSASTASNEEGCLGKRLG
jgi:short-subunit dehydrogenase